MITWSRESLIFCNLALGSILLTITIVLVRALIFAQDYSLSFVYSYTKKRILLELSDIFCNCSLNCDDMREGRKEIGLIQFCSHMVPKSANWSKYYRVNHIEIKNMCMNTCWIVSLKNWFIYYLWDKLIILVYNDGCYTD